MEKETPILRQLSFDRFGGSLDYRGIRYMLIRPETVVEIQKVTEELFGRQSAAEILFRSGYKGTSLTTTKLLQQGMSAEEIIDSMFRMGGELGWGVFELLELGVEEEGRFKVAVSNSPFAGVYGPSAVPVCHLLRGAIAGIFSILFQRKFNCDEIRCLAQGEERCLFVGTAL